MLEIEEKSVIETFVAAFVCNKCKRRIDAEDLEFQEALSVRLVGGYSSIFGDGAEVEIDLCQECLKEVLGPWLVIK